MKSQPSVLQGTVCGRPLSESCYGQLSLLPEPDAVLPRTYSPAFSKQYLLPMSGLHPCTDPSLLDTGTQKLVMDQTSRNRFVVAASNSPLLSQALALVTLAFYHLEQQPRAALQAMGGVGGTTLQC